MATGVQRTACALDEPRHTDLEMKTMSECYLYGIVDRGYVASERIESVTDELVRGGIDMLQLRAKNLSQADIAALARRMLRITQRAGVPLIINDYPDVLQEVEADGCHIGQEDHSVAEARRLAGRPCIVGKSTHSIAQARSAESEGADYIGFGPLFATATKLTARAIGLDDVRPVHGCVKIPIFCIGGVKRSNLHQVRAAGAKRVCIVSDLLLAEDIVTHTHEVKASLGR
ncbi:MAG: thiamine phosphate synthase [Chthoniobacterales bacterium]